jgi:hypothetical protein
MTILREFTCSLTGDELVIINNAFGEEVCILKSEYLEIKSYAAYELARLQSEIF